MKRKFLILCLILTLLFTSCQMEEIIPEQGDTFALFYENESSYRESVDSLLAIDYNCLISRTDFYRPDGSENFTGLYIQNMSDSTFSECNDHALIKLFESSSVKLVDFMKVEELKICTFDMCVPGRNFDYGIYYVSEDEPVYFGDVSITLQESGTGFSYQKSASYGTKFTYYTEKITDHFYYYEIS